MSNLIRNEWIKIMKRVGTIVMFVILAIAVLGSGALLKYEEGRSSHETSSEWKKEVEAQIATDQKNLTELGDKNANMKMHYEREIAINEYRLEQNIAPETENHIWSFVSDSIAILGFAGMFMIIIASGMVASEFSWGTMKMLLIRPISRTKILLSKYITVLLFGLFLMAFIFVLSAIVGLILFGTPTTDSSHLAYANGKVEEQNIVTYLIGQYLLSSIDIIMMSTLSFMISAIFRNSSLAIGVSMFLLFSGSTATMLLASRYEWTKYILFANTDLTVYFDGVPPIDGMTLGFSITMLIVYFIIFHALAFTVFRKRDVAA